MPSSNLQLGKIILVSENANAKPLVLFPLLKLFSLEGGKCLDRATSLVKSMGKFFVEILKSQFQDPTIIFSCFGTQTKMLRNDLCPSSATVFFFAIPSYPTG